MRTWIDLAAVVVAVIAALWLDRFTYHLYLRTQVARLARAQDAIDKQTAEAHALLRRALNPDKETND